MSEPRDPSDLRGADLLDAVNDFLGRYIAFPNEASHTATALWVAHTHGMDNWDSTPRIAFLSPEPGSGKTRALEVMELLVPRPVLSVSVTPAYLVRKVADDEEGRPTILFDEIDTVFGPKARDNEEIRGLLNAGHRKGATAGRCVVRGKVIETEELPAYCAVAMAGLGGLPDTILSRSIVIPMRRRSPGERVQPFRPRTASPWGTMLRQALSGWLGEIEPPSITGIWPEPPPGVADRDADVWEPLFAIADAAGGRWPELARVSAVTLVTASRETPPSLGVRLLADIKPIIGEQTHVTTAHLLVGLNGREESPWGDLHGKPLDARGLARRLRPYGIRPVTVRMEDETAKGYRREDFQDAWSRYLGPPPQESVTSVTSDTAAHERNSPLIVP